jgi:hypothetical protein
MRRLAYASMVQLTWQHFARSLPRILKGARSIRRSDVSTSAQPGARADRLDLRARKAVGPRWAPVFMTPVRPALEARDYVSAAAVSLRPFSVLVS